MTESSSQRTESPSSDPARRRPYSDDFRRDAVRLVVEESYSIKAAAKAVGVCEKSLRDWHKKFGPTTQLCSDDATAEQLRDENKRLRKQLKRTEMEREILKKATAYFAKESQ
jgi:transposase